MLTQLQPHHVERLTWYWYVIYGGVSFFLILFAGLMSGLTLGLLSLDKLTLNILKTSGTKQEQRYARKIAPLLRNHHLLLVTLLLCNATAMETLPLFLDKMMPEIAAILFSVLFVLLFGEIIPQAVCTRYGLAIGAYPIAFPISKLLDCVLGGDHISFFRRAQLKELVSFHGANEHGGYLTLDEITVIRGALDLKEKSATSCMTKIENVFCLSWDTLIDSDVLHDIVETGHSRIPIYRGTEDNIIGIFLVKTMISKLYDKMLKGDLSPIPICKMELRDIPVVPHTLPLWDLLNEFQTGKSHMAVVVEDTASLHNHIVSTQHITETMGINGDNGPNNETNGESRIIINDTPRIAYEHPPTPMSPPILPDAYMHRGGMALSRSQSSRKTGTFRRKPPVIERAPSMAVPKYKVLGIITLEDIIEEIMQEEILDETDHMSNSSSQTTGLQQAPFPTSPTIVPSPSLPRSLSHSPSTTARKSRATGMKIANMVRKLAQAEMSRTLHASSMTQPSTMRNHHGLPRTSKRDMQFHNQVQEGDFIACTHNSLTYEEEEQQEERARLMTGSLNVNYMSTRPVNKL